MSDVPRCVADASGLSDSRRELASHVQAVSVFLKELYAVMIDPCAEGALTVEEMCRQLLARAIADREVLAQMLRRPTLEELERILQTPDTKPEPWQSAQVEAETVAAAAFLSPVGPDIDRSKT